MEGAEAEVPGAVVGPSSGAVGELKPPPNFPDSLGHSMAVGDTDGWEGVPRSPRSPGALGGTLTRRNLP